VATRSDLGFFIVRFPHPDDPGDTGWHIDSSFALEGEPTEDYFNRWRVNVSSRERALLMLFLYSDVGPDDAPTRIRVGSHLDLPPVLLPVGAGGMTGAEASALATQASASRRWRGPWEVQETSTSVIRSWFMPPSPFGERSHALWHSLRLPAGSRSSSIDLMVTIRPLKPVFGEGWASLDDTLWPGT
jgi:hypothetical protein